MNLKEQAVIHKSQIERMRRDFELKENQNKKQILMQSLETAPHKEVVEKLQKQHEEDLRLANLHYHDEIAKIQKQSEQHDKKVEEDFNNKLITIKMNIT